MLGSNKQAIAAAFSRAANQYDCAARLQRYAGEKLLQLYPIKESANIILDAGCGTGYFSRKIATSQNHVIALDLSSEMLNLARQNKSAQSYLIGDIERLPFPSQYFDLIYSNLALQWCDLSSALRELYRVVRPGGCVLFSSLYQGSLHELAYAWAQIDNRQHINAFLPLTSFYSCGFDNEITFHHEKKQLLYPDLYSLLKELKGVGATHLQQGRKEGLMGRGVLQRLTDNYPTISGQFPLSYHLIYGQITRSK